MQIISSMAPTGVDSLLNLKGQKPPAQAAKSADAKASWEPPEPIPLKVPTVEEEAARTEPNARSNKPDSPPAVVPAIVPLPAAPIMPPLMGLPVPASSLAQSHLSVDAAMPVVAENGEMLIIPASLGAASIEVIDMPVVASRPVPAMPGGPKPSGPALPSLPQSSSEPLAASQPDVPAAASQPAAASVPAIRVEGRPSPTPGEVERPQPSVNVPVPASEPTGPKPASAEPLPTSSEPTPTSGRPAPVSGSSLAAASDGPATKPAAESAKAKTPSTSNEPAEDLALSSAAPSRAASDSADTLTSDEEGERDQAMEAAQAPGSVSPKTEPATTSKAEARPLTTQETLTVIREASDAIASMAAARAGKLVRIVLNPEHLGTITVVLKSAGQDLGAELFASRDSVRSALQENQAQLAQAMEAKGYSLTSVNVSSEASHTPFHDPAETRSGLDHRSREDAPGGQRHTPAQKEAMPAFSHRRWSYAGAGVDIWI